MCANWSRIGVCAVALAAIASAVLAEEKHYAQEGHYIGIAIPYNTVGGDFDGETLLTLQDSDTIAVLPKIESNYGYGILLGVREARTALEFSYLWSNHKGTFQGVESEVEYYLFNIDGKYYFLSDKPIQPYLLGGMTCHRLVVKNGKTTCDISCQTGGNYANDAVWQGVGLNLGSGIAFYLHPRWSLSGGIIYRWIEIGYESDVVASDQHTGKKVDISGLNFIISTAFAF